MTHLNPRKVTRARIGAALLCLAWGATLSGQTNASGTASVAIEISDRSGREVERARVEDLRASSEDRPIDLLDLTDSGHLGTWEIAIYVDQRFSSSRSILRLLESLADQATELTALGEVQIILTDEEPESVLRTSDSELLKQTLLDLSLRTPGNHALRYDRARFLRRLAEEDVQPAEAARLELMEELEILRRRQDDLIYWLASRGRPSGPRALLLLDESQALDPMDFYGDYLSRPEEVASELGGPPSLDSLARVLGSYGWTFLPSIVPLDSGEDDKRLSLRTNRSVGFKLRLGGRKDNEGEEPEPGPEELHLFDGRKERLDELATATGGFVLPDIETLPAQIARLSRRRRLELGGILWSGEPLALRVTSRRPGFEVLAPAYIGGTPEEIAEVRIRRSLAGGGDAGELPLRAKLILDPDQLETRPARLEVLADLSLAAARSIDRPLRIRISVGIHLQDGELLLRHETVEARPEAGAFWSWESELMVPPSSDAAVVVLSDLNGDLWGENFADFITVSEAAEVETTSLPEVASRVESGPALRLLPLPANARSGKVKVRSKTSPRVAEVIFLLDGERVGRRRRAPFEMRIDLGPTPDQRSIIAIAYDASGHEVGRDGLVVNEAATSFWIHITEPAPGRRVGAVDVEASVRLPENRRLESVEYYWNDQLVHSTASAPHRSRILIPVGSPAGYIRVVATLDDGSTAEDIVLMNTRRFDAEITVELIELYVVVTDRLGRPVQGLGITDFLIREEEEVQQVEHFTAAGELPLTLGLAIDSSLSLFMKMPDVQKAATHFVNSLQSDRDRAFLVGFGSSPRMVHPVTGNLNRITRAINSLEPSGNTAVWEAIDLALTELDEAKGRKALVVFYDGDDEDEQYSFRKTMGQARKSLIPIYLIVMNDEAARTQGKGFSVRSRIAKLDQLARTGGGRVFFVRTDQDLTPIFDDIGSELRSHYLLTYYPQRPLANPEWRPIHIEMTRSELKARTISGYGGR